MDQAHGRFVKEEIMVPRFRPGAAIIETASGGGRKHAHPIDLQIRLARGMDKRHELLMIGNDGRSADIADAPFGQYLLRQNHVKEMFATSRGGVEQFSIRREVQSPGITGAGSDLFEG